MWYCKVICSCVLFSVLVFGFVTTVVLYYYRPITPHLRLVSFNVSPIILNHSSTSWNLTFLAQNPHKNFQISLDNLYVSLFYQHINLWSQRLPEFSMQPQQDSHYLLLHHATTVAKSVNTTSSDHLVQAMKMDAEEDHAVHFDVNLRASVTASSTSRRKIRKLSLSVFCDRVKIVFLPQDGPGSMVSTPTPKCYQTIR